MQISSSAFISPGEIYIETKPERKEPEMPYFKRFKFKGARKITSNETIFHVKSKPDDTMILPEGEISIVLGGTLSPKRNLSALSGELVSLHDKRNTRKKWEEQKNAPLRV